MIKPCTFFRLIAFFLFIVIPSLLLRANGEPTGNPPNGGPGSPDSIATILGHCNPITKPVVNCVTHTVELSAWVQYTFTGILDPVVATWSNGVVAHKITVVPPGIWDWDASFTGCEPNHWDNTYNQPGSFFLGTVDILGQPLCPNEYIELSVVPPYNIYSFPNYEWNPSCQGCGYPYEVTQPGLYQLTVTDQLGCTFTDQYNVPLSPPVVPTLSGPLFMSPVGDTGIVKVDQPWSAYQWSTGETTNSIVVTEPGIYEVIVTNQFGCTGNAYIGIQEYIPPPWTVIPTSRNHTIIIPDSLKLDAFGGGLQIGDQIGVFYDSAATGVLKCAGYGVWSGLTFAFAAYGNDAVPPAQNGFNTGEMFKIKFWRATSNQIFDATVQYAPIGWLSGLITQTNAFADDGVSMITSLTEGITHAIPLNSGWNMISSYIIPTHPDMLKVFEPIASSIDIVKDGEGKSCIPAIPINIIGDWNLLKGYQVRANQKDTLIVLGHKAVPQANPIPLHTGWQIIGYLRDSPQNIDTVFKAIKTQINLVKNNDGKIYSPQFGINQIGNMIPGQGYKVKALSNVVLSYRPNFTAESPVAERAENLMESDMPHFVLDSNLNTGNNSTIILTDSIANIVMDTLDEIGVFTQAGVLCGTAKYQKDNLAITVWGDDPSTSGIFEGMKNAEAYKFKVWDISEQKECKASITFLSGINAYAPDAIEVIQTLTLALPTYATITAAACNSYVLNNQTYTSSGIYTQILTNAAGCDSTITLNLTINPVPTVMVNNQAICPGQMATLSASGAANYLWSNGATTNSITVSPNATTTYTVIGITAGCTSSPATALVTVKSVPTVVVNSETICFGQMATLMVSGAEIYLWSTGATTNSITVSPNATTSYTVTGTTSGCSSTPATTQVTVKQLPVVAVNSETICAGQTAFLTASGAANYLWSTGATTNLITVSPTTTTTYTVTGTTAGCSTSVAGSVTVNPLPTIDLGPNISLPAGGEVILEAMCACQTYLWSTGATTDAIIVNSMGIYTVTVSNAVGCTATDEIVILTTSTKDPGDGYRISVSPNPTNDLLIITCQGASTSSVQVVDNLGKLLLNENAFVPDGIPRTISLKEMPSGSFYIRIVGDGFAKTISVIKE